VAEVFSLVILVDLFRFERNVKQCIGKIIKGEGGK
jgi:hypothetical protein